MPFPFILPTTSALSISSFIESSSHPSLPLTSSTYRGVVRETLKKHKRLPAQSVTADLSNVLLSLNNYVPYLLALDAGLSGQAIAGEEVHAVLKSNPTFEWRPTLSDNQIPGREAIRTKLQSLEYEVYFVLSTLAYTHSLLARSVLQPLYSQAAASPSPDQRTTAIQAATKYLLTAGSIHDYLATRSQQISASPPCPDVSSAVFRALSSLALAEATLLAVLKDDPYPATVAQDRNANDKEWMIKAPDLPKVRAHLFARLCLAAADHAANAHALLSSTKPKTNESLCRYVDDLRKTGRAKACRFFGIDAELGGETGQAIAWLQAGQQELGLQPVTTEGKKSFSLGKLKKDWQEKREDKKIEKGVEWGMDAGRFEEGRVLQMLEKKWTKMNDTMNTQLIPPIGPLLSTMPSGREIHKLTQFKPSSLGARDLEAMRAPPEGTDEVDEGESSLDEDDQPPGAFPDHNSSSYY